MSTYSVLEDHSTHGLEFRHIAVPSPDMCFSKVVHLESKGTYNDQKSSAWLLVCVSKQLRFYWTMPGAGCLLPKPIPAWEQLCWQMNNTRTPMGSHLAPPPWHLDLQVCSAVPHPWAHPCTTVLIRVGGSKGFGGARYSTPNSVLALFFGWWVQSKAWQPTKCKIGVLLALNLECIEQRKTFLNWKKTSRPGKRTLQSAPSSQCRGMWNPHWVAPPKKEHIE